MRSPQVRLSKSIRYGPSEKGSDANSISIANSSAVGFSECESQLAGIPFIWNWRPVPSKAIVFARREFLR